MSEVRFNDDKERMEYIEIGLRGVLDNLDASGEVVKYIINKDDDGVIQEVIVEVSSKYAVLEVNATLHDTICELVGETGLSDESFSESLLLDVLSRDTEIGRMTLSKYDSQQEEV